MHRFLGFLLGLILGLTPLLKHSKIISSPTFPITLSATPTPAATTSGVVLSSENTSSPSATPIITPQDAAKISLDDLEAELNSLFIESEDFSDL